MTTTQQKELDSNRREEKRRLQADRRESFHALIAEQVLHVLGQPAGLIQVQVRPLWEDHFRVNVYVGEGVTSSTIVNSYFLVVDGNGNIIAATPTIVKQY
jgi:hypothetical protein